MAWLRDQGATVRLAIAHVQFEAIHPFRYGNGRVGRLLLPIMLADDNYPPVYLAGYLKSNQRSYYDTLLAVPTIPFVKYPG